jgi:hypothetical protein
MSQTQTLQQLTTVTASGRSYTRLPYDPNLTDTHHLYVPTRTLKIIGGMLSIGQPVAVLGESGAAKTELARAIMNRAKIDVFHQMEFGGITSGDQLDGMFTFEGNETKHYPSEHLKAVRSAAAGLRVGYVQDELNRGSQFGLNKLLRLYATPYEYVSDIDGVLRVKPKDLLTIATLNVGFGYTGTNKVDIAIANRYRAVRLEPPPIEILSRILEERFVGIDPDAVKGIGKIYQASRASEDAYRLGVRDAIGLAQVIVHCGLDLIDAVEELLSGSAQLHGLPEEAVESVIATAKSVGKKS